MKDLKVAKLLKCSFLAGRLFHGWIIRSAKKCIRESTRLYRWYNLNAWPLVGIAELDNMNKSLHAWLTRPNITLYEKIKSCLNLRISKVSSLSCLSLSLYSTFFRPGRRLVNLLCTLSIWIILPEWWGDHIPAIHIRVGVQHKQWRHELTLRRHVTQNICG